MREVPTNINDPIALRGFLREVREILVGQVINGEVLRPVTNLRVTPIEGANVVEFTKSNAEQYLIYASLTPALSDAVYVPIGRENKYTDTRGQGAIKVYYWVQPVSGGRPPGPIEGPVNATTLALGTNATVPTPLPITDTSVTSSTTGERTYTERSTRTGVQL